MKGHKIVHQFTVSLDDGRTITSDVYLLKPKPGLYEEKMTFEVEEKNAGIRLKDPDINVLRTQFEKAVRSFYAIKWDLFLMVKVHAQWSEVSFEYEWWVIGARPDGDTVSVQVHTEPEAARDWLLHGPGSAWHDEEHKDIKPWDGKWDVQKTLEHSRGSYRHLTDGLPKTGFHTGHDSTDRMVEVLIPATPENFQCVVAFKHAVQKLGRDIVERFRPNNVDASLALIKKMTMMPMLTGQDVVK